MTVGQLKKALNYIPDEVDVFLGTYEHVGINGKETWALFDVYFYFIESLNSCRSSLPTSYSVVGPTLIVASETENPSNENPILSPDD